MGLQWRSIWLCALLAATGAAAATSTAASIGPTNVEPSAGTLTRAKAWRGLRREATARYDDNIDVDDDELSDDAAASENEIIFVAIIASILICGCGCLSGNCGNDDRNYRQGPLNEPLITRDELRRDIFANSLVGNENEWLCPVCAFENRPRNNMCTLCGATQDTAVKYYNRVRTHQRQQPGGGGGAADVDDDLGKFRVTMVAPGNLGAASLGRQSAPRASSLIGGREAVLTTSERQEAFMVRRFNKLTLRQKAAHRRRLWQRRAGEGTGEMEWVRVLVGSPRPGAPRGTGGGDDDDAETVDGEEGGDQFESAESPLARASQDSFGDTSHMAHSPGFKSVLDSTSPGSLQWQKVTGVASATLGPIKQRIVDHAAEEESESMRSSVPQLEVENEQDLVAIAALPFRRKQQWLQSVLDALRHPELVLGPGAGGGVVRLLIRRDHILEDSFSQIMSLEPHLMARRLRIVFKDEPGIDAGGPLREWCLLLCQQLFDPSFALFLSRGDAGYSINPVSGLCNSLHLKYFRFAGRFIGKALLEHQTIPAHLSLPMLKHILSVPISFSDLEFEDAELYQHLCYLRDVPGAEALDLDFTVEVEHLGVRQTHELVAGGASLAVTDANKGEYLLRRFKLRMLDSISEQLWQLLCGLYEVVPKEALSVFDYQELELLISGVPEIDVDDWVRHSRYVGLFKKQQAAHEVVQWFWEVVRTYSHEERARLLQFTTGSARLPAQGFKALEANDGNFRLFTLAGVSKADFLYPRSHTCFNRIDLPLYESKEELGGYLSLVINMEITGFSDE